MMLQKDDSALHDDDSGLQKDDSTLHCDDSVLQKDDSGRISATLRYIVTAPDCKETTPCYNVITLSYITTTPH